MASVSSPVSSWFEWHKDTLPSSMQPTTWVEFGKGAESLQPENSDGQRPKEFGVLHLEMGEVPITRTPLALVFNIDKSSSMNEECENDGQTKLQHMQHIMKSICHLLAKYVSENPELSIQVCFMLFSHNVQHLFEYPLVKHSFASENSAFSDKPTTPFVEINLGNLQMILDALDKITCEGLTNMEKSLKSAYKIMSEYHASHPTHRIIHIQLTDGEPTAGKKHPVALEEFVDVRFKNIFVGVGDDHDGVLLHHLADLAPYGEYRFIDQMSKSPWVCGEIVQNLLYSYDDAPSEFGESYLHLSMGPGVSIYDWRSNTWKKELDIPMLQAHSQKQYHVALDASASAVDAVAHLEKRDGGNSTLVDTVTSLPGLIDIETNQDVMPDLTVFVLRQLTQECLFMVREFAMKSGTTPEGTRELFRWVDAEEANDMDARIRASTRCEQTEADIRTRLRDVQKLLYIGLGTVLETSDESMIHMLLDDLAVALHTLGTRNGYMYTTARQVSQGNQYMYSPSTMRSGAADTPATVNYDDGVFLKKLQSPYMNDSVFSISTQLF